MTRLTFSRATPIAAFIAAAICLVPSPAQASIDQGYVSGSGTVTDDWGDEGEISTNGYRRSGATGLWQWVLYADGAIESNGGAFDIADIDCDFGPNTTAATRSWQRIHDLSDDGKVGTNTFSRADNKLTLTSERITYVGRAHTVSLGLRTTGRYWIDVPGCTCDGATFLANYGTPQDAPSGSCW